jgi:hypothetical protein
MPTDLLSYALGKSRDRRKAAAKRQENRTKLLADPMAIDKLAGEFAEAFSPSVEKGSTKIPSRVTRTESVIDKDSPMHSVGKDYRDLLTNALQNADLSNLSVEELKARVGQAVLAAPTGDRGIARIEAAHERKYQDDTAIGNFFGVFGPDDNSRELPGYQDFVERKRAEEVESHYTNPLVSAVLGGATPIAQAAAGRLAARAGLAGVATVLGTTAAAPAVATAAALSIPAFLAYDIIGNMIDKSDYGRARPDSMSKEMLKIVAGGIVPGVAGMKGVTTALSKAAQKKLISTSIEKQLMRVPTAAKAIQLGNARRKAGIATVAAEKALKEKKWNSRRVTFNLLKDKERAAVKDAEILAADRTLSAAEKAGIKASTKKREELFNALMGQPAGTVMNSRGEFVKMSAEEARVVVAKAGIEGIDKATVQTVRDIRVAKAIAAEEKTKGYVAEILEKRKAGKKVSKVTKARATVQFLEGATLDEIEALPRNTVLRRAQRLRLEKKKALKSVAEEREIKVANEVLAKKRDEHLARKLAIDERARSFGIEPYIVEDTADALTRLRAQGASLSEIEAFASGDLGILDLTKSIEKKLEKDKLGELAKLRTRATTLYDKYIDAVDEMVLTKDIKREVAENILKEDKRFSALERVMRDYFRALPEEEIVAINVTSEAKEKALREMRKLSKKQGDKYRNKKTGTGITLDPIEEAKRLKAAGKDLGAYIENAFGTKTANIYRIAKTTGKTDEQAYASAYRSWKRTVSRSGRAFNAVMEERAIKEGIEDAADTVVPGAKGKLEGKKESWEDLVTAEHLAEYKSYEKGDLDTVFSTVGNASGKKGIDPKGPLMKTVLLGAATIPVASLLGESNADAGTLSGITTVASKAAVKILEASGLTGEKLAERMLKARYITPSLREGQKSPAVPMRQLVLSEALEKGKKNTFQKKVTRVKSLPLALHRILTPHAQSAMFYEAGFRPSIQLATMQTAMHVNSRRNLEVVANTLKAVPNFKNVTQEAVDAMKPLAEKYSDSVIAFAAVDKKLETRLKVLQTQLKAKGKATTRGKKAALTKKINKINEELERLKAAHKELEPTAKKFFEEHSKVEKILAKKYPSSRIALAVEDTADYQFRPWLAGIMTKEEELAVARLKQMNNHYTDRMKARGIRVIQDQPFMHHAWHPSWNVEGASKLLDDMKVNASPTMPFVKFHKRVQFSRQMVPDAAYAMSTYIRDAEKRLQWSTFWDTKNTKGWYWHSRSATVQNSEPLRIMWQQIKNSAKPPEMTGWNKAANAYSAIEAFNLLAGQPSTAFKHLFKLQGTWATFGFTHSMKTLAKGAEAWAFQRPIRAKIANTLGVKGTKTQGAIREITKAYGTQYGYTRMMLDMHMGSDHMMPTFWGKFSNLLRKANDKGSVLIQSVEDFDRAHNAIATLDMAARRGMTEKDALYGVVDTILTNNFLGGELSAAWMRNPTIRAALMFQSTPWKIMERRLLIANRMGKEVKAAYGVIKKEGVKKALSELYSMRKDALKGEALLKQNLMYQALSTEADFFGTSATKQFMREALYTGMIIFGVGEALDADFVPHTFHWPLLKHNYQNAPADPTLAVSPFVGAAYKTLHGISTIRDPETGDFSFGRMTRNWLGTDKAIPAAVHKALRLSENDIPEVYKGSKLKYIFAVPTKGE